MSVATVWLVGAVNAPELADAVRWLQSRAECQTFSGSRDAAAAATQAAKLGAANEPELIVLCEVRPGQIRACDAAVTSRAFPLARIVALAGPWCEGERLSACPWPGATRIYWHQWQTRLAAEFSQIQVSRPVPPTATEVDRTLRRLEVRRPVGPALLVGVVSASRVSFEALSQALVIAGSHAVWFTPRTAPPVTQMDALVIDAGGNVAAAIDEVEAIRSRFGPAPSAILCDFPRPEDMERVSTLPQAVLLSKPFRIDELFSSLTGLPQQMVPATVAAA